jgi:anti-sigma factor RsiW
MACQKYELLILEYVDGTLSAEDRRELESHFRGCEPCTRFRRLQEKVDVMLASAIACPPLSNGFKERMMRRAVLDRAERRRLWQLPELFTLVGYISIAAAVGVVLQYLLVLVSTAYPPKISLDSTLVYSTWALCVAFFLAAIRIMTGRTRERKTDSGG